MMDLYGIALLQRSVGDRNGDVLVQLERVNCPPHLARPAMLVPEWPVPFEERQVAVDQQADGLAPRTFSGNLAKRGSADEIALVEIHKTAMTCFVRVHL